MDDISPTAMQAARDTFVVVSRLRRRLRRLEGAGDLSPAQASVLATLAKDGPASVSELAAGERVRHQSMVATVAALERAGLVERHPDPQDGRRQLITLTERGEQQRAGDLQVRQAYLARALMEHGTAEELQAVITTMALLDRVAQS